MKIVSVIHARGGSVRIPLKNLANLGGKPLIAYPIELSRGINIIERTIVSTDHPKIRDEAIKYGAEVPFVRPADISKDVPSELVTEHALKYMLENENYYPDICITMTPTTPFTTREKLEHGIELLLRHPEWDSVVTLRKAIEFPEWMIEYEPENACRTVLGNPLDGEFNVSQNLKQRYYPLGAFFINWVEKFLKKPSLYGEKWGAVYFSMKRNIDIDEMEDLHKAENILMKN